MYHIYRSNVNFFKLPIGIVPSPVLLDVVHDRVALRVLGEVLYSLVRPCVRNDLCCVVVIAVMIAVMTMMMLVARLSLYDPRMLGSVVVGVFVRHCDRGVVCGWALVA